MMLESFVAGRWQSGTGKGRALVNPTNGEVIAHASSEGLDIGAAIEWARSEGVTNLSTMNFAERGQLLKAVADKLGANRDAYLEIARVNSGNTSSDASIDIDGAIFTLKHYARLGATLGMGRFAVEPGEDQLAREPVFFSRHILTGRPGVAVQVNAFNFPAWGMWEKAAVSLLAGVPVFAKPATATAILAQRMVRDVIEAGILPKGAISILCGGGEEIARHLGPMDSLAFTGSAGTGIFFRQAFASRPAPARLNIEADSVNATILGCDVRPGTELFDLAVREVVKALSVKAGQLCTNIRRVLVPEAISTDFTEAVAAKIARLKVGDPADEATRVGPLVNAAQRRAAESNIARLLEDCEIAAKAPMEDMPDASGFVAPHLLTCHDPLTAQSVHEIEVFGPCATILPYASAEQASMLVARGEGSLAVSLFSDDRSEQIRAAKSLGPWHGRIMMVDSDVGKAHTGHFNVMPQCLHGGPGRAGGGEELGGLGGLRFHMQRTAVQGSPAALSALSDLAVEISI